MKKVLFILLMYSLLNFPVNAQIVTTDPAVPVVDQPVTIYFDATQGTGGLKDYTGDVYAHTGVITDQSTSGSDWKYVKTSWGQNTPETKMTRISANLYKLDIGPSIREYYNVPSGEKITDMAFVFRSDFPYSGTSYYEGKETGGLDIFVEVFEQGLNVTITVPQGPYVILTLNDSLPVSASATQSDSLALFVNNIYRKHGLNSTLLTDTIVADSYGEFWIKAVAYGSAGFVADSFFCFVRPAPAVEDLPAGLQEGINYTSDTSVTLVLFAPYKNHVFVIGDFTGWSPSQKGYMKITPDGERYWVSINGLTPGKEYRYQYLVDDTLIIADPYTAKVLDPWNDPYISPVTYPGLIPYPTDSTTGIVSVLQPARQTYLWHDTGFVAPEKNDLVIYELLIRDFVAKHDYKTLIDTLDYFDRLGVNAIELMPVNEFEGNESWGYNPSFYFAPDKYYGPATDLKAFIDSCHRRGMAVILDMVLNHSYGQSPLVQLYLDRTTWQVTAQNPWYNQTSPNPFFSWGYDFNHESPATKAFVNRVTRYWIREFHADGYRFDFTKGFTNTPGDGWARDNSRIAILERIADSIRTVKPNAILILEHFTDNSEEKILSDYGLMLWGNGNCNFSQASMGYASGPCGSWDYSWSSYKNRGWTQPGLVNYMESHDEERLMFKNLTYGNGSGDYNIKNLTTALKRIEMTGLMFFTIPGPKMLWEFEELGYDYSIDYDCRVCNKPILWNYQQIPVRLRLYQVFSALIRLKKEEPAFDTQDFTVSASDPVKYNILRHTDMNVVVIGNFDVAQQTSSIPFPETGIWYEYFTGDSLEVTNTNTDITLIPGEYRLYTTKKLGSPDITAGIHTPGIQGEITGLRIYPNPAEGPVQILFPSKGYRTATISLFDPLGKLILNKTLLTSPGITVLKLDPADALKQEDIRGFYLLRIRTEGKTSIRKLVFK
ncbi:MAG: T9SS type A sorting domain-containing protein [Chlorobi bacterium]|nr:T9SS type A sorting domain-containing protein [Chlorobiota bacterium]